MPTDKQELEHYDRIGAMHPRARVARSVAYIIAAANRDPNKPFRHPDSAALRRLDDDPKYFAEVWGDLKTEELPHPFDREAGKNPFLFDPAVSAFTPWADFDVPISANGWTRKESRAEHYYAHWQVQVLLTIQRYPDLFKTKSLIERIEPAKRTGLPRAPNPSDLLAFGNKAGVYDALSFWITIHGREQRRTFARVSDQYGVKQLDSAASTTYQSRVRDNAAYVQTKFGVTSDDLLTFVSSLVGLHAEHMTHERLKLAREVHNDILWAAELLHAADGSSVSDIAKSLDSKGGWGTGDAYRHQYLGLRELDEAYSVVHRTAARYGDLVASAGFSGTVTRSFAETEIKELLNFCQEEGFSILLTALSGMVATEEQEAEKFRRATRYTNLKNVLTSFEYLLKDLATRGGLPVDRLTSVPLVNKVMATETGWVTLFWDRKGLAGAPIPPGFFSNATSIRSDAVLKTSEQAFWAQVFLLTCLARNLTIHAYTEEDWYYGDFFGQMLDMAILAILYTWQLAEREKWIV